MPVSLVTGGAGFIGSHVCRELLSMGHEVVVVDDLSGGDQRNLPGGITFFEVSILDHLFLENLFKKHSFDYVYHLAAYAAEGLSHFIKRFNYQNNLIGTVNLINESIKHKVKCFVFTSSIAVYGSQEPPMIENMTPNPEDPYGIAKYTAEQELKVSHEVFGLDYVIFRPHNVYGEYQNIGDKYRNVIGIFMNQAMQDKPMTVFGDGLQTRAFSYIEDVAPYIAQSAEISDAYGETFNIGADEEITINQLAELISAEIGGNTGIVHLDIRNEVKHAYASHEKAKKFFNIDKHTPLREGLSKMATWAKNTGIRKSRPFKYIEIYDHLPSSWKD